MHALERKTNHELKLESKQNSHHENFGIYKNTF